MADNKKSGLGIVVGVSILLVGVAAFFVIKGIKAKANKGADKKDGKDATKTDDTKSETTTIKNSLTEISGSTDWKFPIRRTQKNDSVMALQNLLLKINPKIIKDGATGFFGSQTEAALLQVLGKKSVTSQADIDTIVKKGTIVNASANLMLNAQLGIPSNTQIVKI